MSLLPEPDLQTEPYAEETAAGAFGVFRAFLALGLTSFGGPIAHLGYFRTAFVERRRWLGERDYADLVALCQILPGPTSSQVGFAIGLRRAGFAGGLAAFAGFTLPSFGAMLLFAAAAARLGGPVWMGLLHGLSLVAVAVVAQAVLGMGRTLCPDRPRVAIALAALAAASLLPGFAGQALGLAIGVVAGFALRQEAAARARDPFANPPRWHLAAGLIGLVLALGLLPLIAALEPEGPAALLAAIARAGALVFGGGHVVLPLLEDATVPALLSADAFLAGYGAAQALPGPLFAFAAYLGSAIGGPLLGLGALLAIFLPGLALVLAALPFWTRLAGSAQTTRVLAGVNAAVVGILGAAFYDPIWTTGVRSPLDFVLAAAGFFALVVWRLPPLAVVGSLATAGLLLGLANV